MTSAARPVFLPREFKLLRRPCKRYPAEKTPKDSREAHQPGQIEQRAIAPAHGIGAHTAVIGDGCYRLLPCHGRGAN